MLFVINQAMMPDVHYVFTSATSDAPGFAITELLAGRRCFRLYNATKSWLPLTHGWQSNNKHGW